MASSRLLGDLSALQLSAELTKDSIIVLPLGAIEQHGPLVRLRNKVEELLGIRRNPDDQHAHHQ